MCRLVTESQSVTPLEKEELSMLLFNPTSTNHELLFNPTSELN